MCVFVQSSFISDPTTRRHLIPASQVNVDFRAACFCHKKVVDIGFVCSICLSSRSPTNPLFEPVPQILLYTPFVSAHPGELHNQKRRTVVNNGAEKYGGINGVESPPIGEPSMVERLHDSSQIDPTKTSLSRFITSI